MERNSNLDLIRIFSALMVLSVHIGQQAGFSFAIGAKGVQLFFILSGYLSMASLDRNSKYISYYKNRLQRILPTYYICLALLYLEALLLQLCSKIPLGEIFRGLCGPGYLRYVFLVHMFLPSDQWTLWNNHSGLWTMSSFAFFYAIAPFIYRICGSFQKSFFTLVVMLFANPFMIRFISVRLSAYPEEAHIEWFATMNPLTELYCFMIGVTLFWAIKQAKINEFSMFMLVALVVTGFTWYSYEFIFTIMIMCSSMMPGIITNNKLNQCILFVSQGSFTLYLVHPIILAVSPSLYIKVFAGETRGMGYACYLYILSISLSYLLYYFLIKKIDIFIKAKTMNP